jgi:hypothetical protein
MSLWTAARLSAPSILFYRADPPKPQFLFIQRNALVRFHMQIGVHISMELSIEKIRYYAVPYMAMLKGPRWFFYLLYPNTYDASFFAPAEDYAGRPWYIIPHATRYGVFAFEVDFDGEYFIVTVCPQMVAEPLLKDILPESVIFVLKTHPAVVIEVHKEGVDFFRKWLLAIKKNPWPFFEAAEGNFFQCAHTLTL